MSDILLTHGYFLSEDEKERDIMRPYAPLGLMYLSSYLKQQGFDVELHDSTFSSRSELYTKLAARPGVLGIYTNLMTRPSVLDIVRAAKARGWTVILGGPESANYVEKYLNHGADFVAVGEGEQTLTELLYCIKNEVYEYSDIPGVCFKDGQDCVIRNAPRELPKDIDQYPWPDREAINIQNYMDAWQTHHGESSVSMITARGCPYKCTWCSHAVFGYSHRRRDYKDCANELEYIVNRFNPTLVWYADDVFTINHKWLFNYASELRRRGLKVPFETISRADRMMDARVMDTLQEMGCFRIWIGAESGSQRLLDDMKRQVTIEQVDIATKEAQKRGIQVGMFLMWGYGDENILDIDETVKSVGRINPDIYLTTVAYPIKGTEFYKDHEENIIAKVKWEEGSDRDLMLSGRKSDRYYRLANKYLKSHVQSLTLKSKNSPLAGMKSKHARWARSALEAAANDEY